MKKKLVSAMLCGMTAAMMLTGCGNSDKIEQTKDKMNIEAGDDFAFKVSDYFEHSNGDEIGDDEYKLDATEVNTDKVGEYTVKVTFGKGDEATEYKIKVDVQDTVAPEIKASGDAASTTGCVYVNDMSADMSAYVEATDKTELTYSTTAEKLGDLTEVTDESVAGYLEQVKAKNDGTAKTDKDDAESESESESESKSESEEKTESTESADKDNSKTSDSESNKENNAQTAEELKELSEGFYLTTVTATDEGGNSAEVSFLVVCDKTAPVVSYNGQQLSDGSTIELENDVNDASEVGFEVKDNTRGTLGNEEYTKTLDKSNGYNFKIDASDVAGNQTSINVTGNVKVKETASNNSGSSSSKKNNKGNSSKNNGGSSVAVSNPEDGDNIVTEPSNNNVQYGVITWDTYEYTAYYKSVEDADAAADAFVKSKLGNEFTGNWDGGGWKNGVYHPSGITASRTDSVGTITYYDMRPNLAKVVYNGQTFNEETGMYEPSKDIYW